MDKVIQCLFSLRNIFLFVCIFLSVNTLLAQNDYWQQQVNFTIHVSLNDKENTLDAFETIEYINHSPNTLRFIWFHIWPNAYKNDRTAFSEQLLKERRTDFYFSKPDMKGYINQLSFKADGSNATIINDSNNIDVVKVLLPKALPPGSKTIITTPFKVKLPYNFSRGGHVGNDYQVTQWFPKPAVYDKTGWHPMPYLDQGEFYSEFGNFDVEITVPSAYVVAATGILQDTTTLREMKENGQHSIKGETKTWHYKQDSIHDFAWFASKDFTVKYDTARLASGKVVDVFSYYKPASTAWKKSIDYAKNGLKDYSKWIGDYPYTVASMVQGSKNENSGGMEYPTITLITTQDSGQELDATIVHEVGHNWFYGALATNERTHPWMDEGMNTFYQKRYENDRYHSYSYLKKSPFSLNNKLPDDEEGMLLETMAKMYKDQPIETTSEDFTTLNYGLIAYVKTSRWMKKLQDVTGKDLFDSSMRQYYRDWKFKHPYPQDFKASLEKSTGKNLDSIFNMLYTTGSISAAEKKTIKPSFLYNLHETQKYNYISFSPAIGYNAYDKVMIGGLIHNFILPLNKIDFAVGALYATGSKKMNSFGYAAYHIYKKNYHLSTSLGYISYSQNDFINRDNTKVFARLQRWTSAVNFTFFDKNVLSTRRFTIAWKTFLLNEGAFNFKTIFSPTDTFDIVSSVNNHSFINRLSFSVSDNRILYPYNVTLSADQGKNFIKTGLTAKYFFNYPDGKSGLSARFFAGKLFYLNSKTIDSRYFLNLSAPKGKEDYTYSDYFIGRNKYEGWQSQQIMDRDGFFKVNTELFNNKIGKTDNWLMSVNLASDLPDNINPLIILPVKIPVKIFADAGTYAEAWKENPASGRFIYDAGIQLAFFKSFINIFIPVVYSKVYRDYYKTTITEKRFLKTISFNINLEKLEIKNFLKDIPL
jgi:hypothetical protein